MQWLYGLGLYFHVARETMPGARAATHLRGTAPEWWQHCGAVHRKGQGLGPCAHALALFFPQRHDVATTQVNADRWQRMQQAWFYVQHESKTQDQGGNLCIYAFNFF